MLIHASAWSLFFPTNTSAPTYAYCPLDCYIFYYLRTIVCLIVAMEYEVLRTLFSLLTSAAGGHINTLPK